MGVPLLLTAYGPDGVLLRYSRDARLPCSVFVIGLANDWRSAARTARQSARGSAPHRRRLFRPRRAFARPLPRREAPSCRRASAVRATVAEPAPAPRSP